jgi:hypothetical protein
MAKPLTPTRATSSWLPWWVAGIVILGILITATGGILALVHPATLVGSNEPMNSAASVYAGYLFSRNLALAILLGAMLSIRARHALAGLMLLTILTQILDIVVDISSGRAALLPPIVILAAAFIVGLARLVGRPLWNISTWQD